MFKNSKSILILLLASLFLSGCDTLFDKSNSDFNYSPMAYWEAKSTNPVQIPQIIDENISRETLYPIPLKQKLKGEIRVSKVPPTLVDKITEYET